MFLRLFIYLFFIVSSFTALAHELLWSRLIKNILLSNLISSAIVLVIFFSGIAFGALLVKYLMKLFSKSKTANIALLFFAIINFALFYLSKDLYNLESIYRLIPISLLLGSSFPLLLDFYVAHRENNEDLKKNTISKVYSVSNFAALFSVVFTIFYLIKEQGLENSITYISYAHIAIASLALLISLIKTKSILGEIKNISLLHFSEKIFTKSPKTLLFLSSLLGFTLLAFETLWIRVFDLCFSSSVYSFAMILASVIASISIGSYAFYLLAKPLSLSLRSEASDLYRKDISLIIKLLVLLAISLIVSVFFLEKIPMLYVQILSNFDFVLTELAREDLYRTILNIIKFIIAFIYIMPSAALMSFIGTYVLQIYHYNSSENSIKHAANSLGTLFFFNTFASMFAALLLAFYLIPIYGLELSSKLIISLLLLSVVVFSFFTKFQSRVGNLLSLFLSSALLVGLFVYKKTIIGPSLASGVDLYYGLKYRSDNFSLDKSKEEVLFHQDGLYSTVSVIKDKLSNSIYLKNNSKLEAAVPIDSDSFSNADMQTQKLLAFSPMFFNSKIESAFLVGMGSGVSLDSLASLPNIKSLEVAEIEELIYEAADKYFASAWLQKDFNGIRRHTENAKYVLESSADKYDLIVSQPSDPWLSVELFTDEFWDLASEKLNTDGIFVQWLQLYSLDFEYLYLVLNTMQHNFKNLLILQAERTGEIIVLGSNSEFKIKENTVEEIFAQDLLRNSLAKISIYSLSDFYSTILLGSDEIRAMLADLEQKILLREPLNTLNNSLLEFHTAENFYKFSKTIKANLIRLADFISANNSFEALDSNIINKEFLGTYYLKLKEKESRESLTYSLESPNSVKLKQVQAYISDYDIDIEKLEANKIYSEFTLEAERLYMNNEFDLALETINQALEIDPNIEEVYLMKAKIYKEQNNDDEFIHNLQICLRINPHNVEALYYLIDYNYHYASLAASYKYLERLLKTKDYKNILSLEQNQNLVQVRTKLENILKLR
ncbi:MAG: hypothetical protein MK033_04060 [Candidatus Caenarcaniphilales bacterium]|nr:hypothetical protein [Candidatus Caenarcaniphilales bacterium]